MASPMHRKEMIGTHVLFVAAVLVAGQFVAVVIEFNVFVFDIALARKVQGWLLVHS